MKRTLFGFLLSIAALNAYCQARVGSSYNEIKTEFSDDNYKFKSDYLDGVLYAEVSFDFCSAVYFFDKDSTCSRTCLLPDDKSALNRMVQYYNESYVIISPQKWKMYSKGGIVDVELRILGDEFDPVFIWE